MEQYKKALFIFRRDLRLADNIGLFKALELSQVVIPCFIFDPRQVGQSNSFASMNAMQYMIESLQELQKNLARKNGHLYLFYGVASEVVEQLIKKEHINAVFVNRDYTPFSINRDRAIRGVCDAHGVFFQSNADLLLHSPDQILKNNGEPYSMFTPFYKKSRTIPVAKPRRTQRINFYSGAVHDAQPATIYRTIVPKFNRKLAMHGGRKRALQILRSLKKYKDYAVQHDFPAMESTTHLSAALKFGTVSPREVYHAIVDQLGKNHPLLRQLYWRDFFTYIAYHDSFVFELPYHEKYQNLPWDTSQEKFVAWCEGRTGFPIVDAGMRQLNNTGFMHNRVRMIVASFLIKDLHINWQWGEKYFAQQLVDYDPAVNNGNWQWVASTGSDAQPYFRIFNPWLQQKKFDPSCLYIKRWVTELARVDRKIIHGWYKDEYARIKKYVRPMVDHAQESEIAKQQYKQVQS